MIRTTLIFTARLCGIAALALGAAFWQGYAVPLRAHMGVGGLVVLALWGLAVLSRHRAGGIALTASLWGAAVPLLGMMQLYPHLDGLHWLLQLAHVLAGLGAIVLAEILAKRVRA